MITFSKKSKLCILSSLSLAMFWACNDSNSSSSAPKISGIEIPADEQPSCTSDMEGDVLIVDGEPQICHSKKWSAFPCDTKDESAVAKLIEDKDSFDIYCGENKVGSIPNELLEKCEINDNNNGYTLTCNGKNVADIEFASSNKDDKKSSASKQSSSSTAKSSASKQSSSSTAKSSASKQSSSSTAKSSTSKQSSSSTAKSSASKQSSSSTANSSASKQSSSSTVKSSASKQSSSSTAKSSASKQSSSSKEVLAPKSSSSSSNIVAESSSNESSSSKEVLLPELSSSSSDIIAESSGNEISSSSQKAQCANKSYELGKHTKEIFVNGVKRSYIMVVNKGYNSEKDEPAALLVDYHGFNENAEKYSSNNPLSLDNKNVIKLYPLGKKSDQGLKTESWNIDGQCCTDADDLEFTREMIKVTQDSLCIDSKRIYATGYNVGGGMAFQAACSMSDIFTAVAPVAFDMTKNNSETCNPERKVPIIMFRGTSDNIIPYVASGKKNIALSDNTILLGAEPTAQFWATKNECSNVTTINEDGCSEFSNCANGARVVLCTQEGEGHKPLDQSTSITAWSFLSSFTMP